MNERVRRRKKTWADKRAVNEENTKVAKRTAGTKKTVDEKWTLMLSENRGCRVSHELNETQ
jgi:hypothetical protein